MVNNKTRHDILLGSPAPSEKGRFSVPPPSDPYAEPLTVAGYERMCAETAIYPNRGDNVLYPVLGLAEEAGEVTGKFKRMIRDDGGVLTEERRLETLDELGDLLWYAATLCYELNVPMEVVMRRNYEKLMKRKAEDKLKGSGDKR